MEHERNEQLFFRFDGREVRVIFTPKYKPVDNFEVMERLDFLGYDPGTEVQCHLDAEFMSLSIPDGNKAFDINGDRFKSGISISNSEVGLASLSIAAFVLRLVCTNGIIAKTDTRMMIPKIIGAVVGLLTVGIYAWKFKETSLCRP